MKKMDLSLVKLLNKLQELKTIINQQAPMAFLIDKAGPSSSKPVKFQKKKEKVSQETGNYILNFPYELWNEHKPSLQCIRVLGCPAYVIKGKTDKLESRTKVYIFIGYPKGTKGDLFYYPKEQKEIRKSIIKNGVAPEQVPQIVIDIPLLPHNGRNVNRHEVAQEKTQDISVPQSSRNNVEQPPIVEEAIPNAQNLVQDVANPVVTSHHSGRVIRKLE
ncbi:uncharacterized protein LOC129872219 [Solanum dulcamara]|uniref:uncharacterized protein LOC129872219 n=1 Tax=Solanum dulcamara TaxID=45834 RepID=UPI00248616E7|nr:uncharacterized protein LOC129872219 [Solanum dulcamara]